MRKLFLVLTVAAVALALSTPAFAKVETVKGQLIDQSCYKMDKSNTGNSHKMPKGQVEDCAVTCAKGAHPVALLTSDGKMYEIAGDLTANKNEKLVAHMAHTVEVTGDVSTAPDGSMKIAGTNLKMVSK